VQYNENRDFSPQNGYRGRYNRLLFQPLTQQIRYLAEQWEINGIFRPINELKRPYQPKNNGIRNPSARGYASSEL
jgi:hypothetical protein